MAVSVALVAFIARNLLDTLRPFKPTLKTNDASRCKLYKGPTGAEDFVLTKNGWIISSSVDAGHLIDDGVDVCKRDTGGLWAFRLSDGGAPTRLEIEKTTASSGSMFHDARFVSFQHYEPVVCSDS